MSTPAGSDPPADLLDSTTAGSIAIRGGTLRGLGYGLGLLLSVASVPFVVRHLGIDDFGRYVLVTALMTLIGGLTDVGLQVVGTREYSTRTAADRDRLMANLLGIRITLTITGVIVAVAFAVVAGYDRVLILGTLLAGAGLLVQSVQTLVSVPLLSQLRLGWSTIAELLRQTVSVSLTLMLVVIGAELLPFFAMAIPGGAASLVLTAVLVRRQMPFRPQFHASEWWQLLRHTLAYAIAIAVNVAYFRIAIVVMSLLATERETGYFAASFRVLEVILPIPALVIGAVFPILARAARDDRRRLAYASQRVFDVALIAGAGLVVAIEVAAPFIIEVLAGDDAEPAVGVLRIQAPALLATFVAVAGGFALLSLHRHRDLLLANFAPLIFSIALTILLVPPYGAEGAAISTTVAEWALAIVTVLLLRRAMEELELSFRAAGPALAAAAVACGVLLLPLPEVMQAALAPGVYVTVLFLLGGIPRELIDALPRRRAS